MRFPGVGILEEIVDEHLTGKPSNFDLNLNLGVLVELKSTKILDFSVDLKWLCHYNQFAEGYIFKDITPSLENSETVHTDETGKQFKMHNQTNALI